MDRVRLHSGARDVCGGLRWDVDGGARGGRGAGGGGPSGRGPTAAERPPTRPGAPSSGNNMAAGQIWCVTIGKVLLRVQRLSI